MAHFYGTVQGHRGKGSRLGSKSSGPDVTAASWSGAVTTRLYEKDGVDMALVCLSRWHSQGIERVLYHGPVSGLEAR